MSGTATHPAQRRERPLGRADRLAAAQSLERIADAIERGTLDAPPVVVAYLRGSIDGLRS